MTDPRIIIETKDFIKVKSPISISPLWMYRLTYPSSAQWKPKGASALQNCKTNKQFHLIWNRLHWNPAYLRVTADCMLFSRVRVEKQVQKKQMHGKVHSIDLHLQTEEEACCIYQIWKFCASKSLKKCIENKFLFETTF